MNQVRWVRLDQCENFRDLGGHPTRLGQSVRHGLLYRADTLENLSDEDHRRFAALGVVTVIDLRASCEIEKRGRLDLTRQAVRYVHVPFVDVVGDPTLWDPADAARPDYPIEGYQQMLADGAGRLAEVLRLLAEPQALPAVFHCISGKDRTGLVAAVVLSLLGVPRAAVAAEYALSEGRNGHSSASAQLKQRYPHVFGAPPANMIGVLAGIEHEHGSVASYVASLGVAADVVERLKRALLFGPRDAG
jgi:protein-tyrosine phosphatase